MSSVRAVCSRRRYRDVDPSLTDSLTTALVELAREPVSRSCVAGLGVREVARFIELISGEAPSEELVATIYEETEGNPLFVGEIVRLLAAEGRLGDMNAPAPPRLAIPQSVRDVISRRLRRLSEECNRLLVLASVLGREFRLAALARAGGVSEDELLDTLDEAMAAESSPAPGRREICASRTSSSATLTKGSRPPAARGRTAGARGVGAAVR
jgi:predicted ATPase